MIVILRSKTRVRDQGWRRRHGEKSLAEKHKAALLHVGVQPGTVIQPHGRRGGGVRLSRHHMDSIVYKFDSHRCSAQEKNKVLSWKHFKTTHGYLFQ